MKRFLKRILPLTLAFLLCFSILPSGAEAKQFPDVPANHWATAYIEQMSEGGLIAGYSNGYFGLNDQFTIAQMCQIICNAKGYKTTIKNGFWGYDAVDYCRSTVKCLPDFGEINAENYEVPITRELATYMIINGLGVTNTTGTYRAINIDDIPDWSDISLQYRDAVQEAYRNRMTVGVDELGTFLPQNTLTRAEGATMLVRAGYTKAAVKSESVTGAVSGAEAFEKIKQLGDWEEYVTDDEVKAGKTGIKFTDPHVGGIRVTYQPKSDFVKAFIPEDNTQFDANGNFLDVNGKVVDWMYNEKTWEFYTSTGYSYEARQFAKKIFECIVGSDAQVVYDSLHRVFDGTVHSYIGGYPSEVLWAGERCIRLDHVGDGSRCMEILFCEKGNELLYQSEMNGRYDGMAWDTRFMLSREHATIAYELNKW